MSIRPRTGTWAWHNYPGVSEIVLRFLAVLLTAVMLIGFGLYFTIGTDTLQHDYIFFGGGVLSLLTGLATLPLAGMILRQMREYSPDEMASDVGGYPELAPPPPARGGAAARGAAAESDDSDSESE